MDGFYDTPFGVSTEMYAERDGFYQSYPEYGVAWDLSHKKERAPKGYDLVLHKNEADGDWMLIFCYKNAEMMQVPDDCVGMVVAFNRGTGFMYVIQHESSFAAAKDAYLHGNSPDFWR